MRNKKSKRNYVKFSTSILSILVFINIVVFLAFLCLLKDLPDIQEMAVKDIKPQITIYGSDNEILAKYGDFRGETLPYSSIPLNIINAVIASEDKRFMSHSGIDFIGILRAYFVNLKAGRVIQGGSTITQQLAKIIYLTPQRTLKRKLQEIIIAIELEKKFSKEQILTFYLNKVYLGKGNFGIDAAAKYYFGKKGSEINLFESAILAGMLKAPSRYSPANSINLANARARQVLLLMFEQAFITKEMALNSKPSIIIERGISRGALKNPYFADYVLTQIPEFIHGISQDISIYTTLNSYAQEKLEQSILSFKTIARTQYNANQAAAVAMQCDGAIRAMMGGFDYKESQFNRAANAKRQPGSSFKFFIYLAGIEHGLGLNDVFIDEPIALYQGKNLPLWKPRNFDRGYRGAISLNDAFKNSVNIISVKILEKIGIDNVIELIHRLGIKQEIPKLLSLSLGAIDVTMMQMIQAYAQIANDGFKVEPYCIIKIKDDRDNILYEHTPVLPDQKIHHKYVVEMKHLLQSVVESGNGKNAKVNEIDVFGKTGTTQDYRDAWFIGFTENMITSVWLGNDDDSPTKTLVGGNIPAKIFQKFNTNLKSIPLNKNTNDSTPWNQENIFNKVN